MNLDYELVLIDCPPGLTDSKGQGGITIGAVLASQFVLVPVQPTFLDYEASEMVIPLLQQVASFRADLQALVVINRKPTTRSRLGWEAKDAAINFFRSSEVVVRVLETAIGDRTGLKESPGAGKTILGYDPKSKAAEEFRRLTLEVIECLKNPVLA
jgi:chromosome partitioning protein